MILRSRIIYALESNCPLCIVLDTDWGSMTDEEDLVVTLSLGPFFRPLEPHLEPLRSHLTTPVTPATCTTQLHCLKSPLETSFRSQLFPKAHMLAAIYFHVPEDDRSLGTGLLMVLSHHMRARSTHRLWTPARSFAALH